MKKIESSTDKNKNKNKNINLSKILNSDLFFQSSGVIKLALNKNRIIDKDFGIKRAKAKIDIGKKNKIKISPKNAKKKIRISKQEEEQNDNLTYFKKKEIPFELADIIENNQTKFEKVFDAFHDIKQKNDLFQSHWHYVQKSKEKAKNKETNNISFNNEMNKDEFYKNLKKYDFSSRDKIELELQKKLTEKLFKSNPLMIKNSNDMLFYYLNLAKKQNLNFKELNPTKYLNKVKEILDFMEIFVDYNTDKMNKDINMQNSNFLMKRQKKIDEENIKLKEEQKRQNFIDNKISKKMISRTKRTIRSLNKNKNYFENPNYFTNNMSSTFYNRNNTSKFLTPNKMNKLSKSSTNFFVGDKNHFNKGGIFSNTIKFLQDKKLNLTKRLSSLIDSEANKEDKIQNKKYSLPNTINNKSNKSNSDIISLFNKKYFISNTKDNTLSRNKKSKLNNLKIIHKSNSLNINSNSLNNNNINFDNNTILPSINKTPYGQSLSRDDRPLYPVKSNFSPKEKEKEKEKEKDKDNYSNIPTSKNNNESSRPSRPSRLSRPSIRKSLLNDSSNDIKIEKEKELKKKNSKSSYKQQNSIIIISDLYDKLKDGKSFNKNNLKHIYNYIHQKNLKKKKKKDTMNLIKDVQLLSDGFDINKVSKNIENIPNKEIKQIKNFKIINNELNKLDKKYVKEICEFKAKNQRNEGQDDEYIL